MNPLQQWAIRHGVNDAALAELVDLYRSEPLAKATGGSESGVQQALRIAAAEVGGALWRNNSGAMLDGDGRMVRYGLGNDSKRLNEVWKSPDLIGPTAVRITPNHVGRIMGVFTAVEVKEPGWKGPRSAHERAQGAFLTSVEALGGIGMFATSREEYAVRVMQVRL